MNLESRELARVGDTASKTGWVVALLIIAAYVGFGGAIFPTCKFLEFTGLHCPGCGGTRSVRALLQGDVLGSLRMNALVFPAVVYVGVMLVRRWFGRSKESLFSCLGSIKTFWWIVGAALLFGIARNFPFEPFVHLRPH